MRSLSTHPLLSVYHLEKDVYEKAAEILKKEMGDNLKEFSNQEKAMVIMALRDKYPVKRRKLDCSSNPSEKI